MRLLVITQALDRHDPILGFFEQWVLALAERCTSVVVIAQRVGTYEPHPRLRVLSLGKEAGQSNVAQVTRCWRYLWSERRAYDTIFVHMIALWVVLSAPIATILQKPLYLWYEARGTRWPLRIALKCVRRVFSASAAGMPLHTRKSLILGHGISTNVFQPSGTARDPQLVIAVGRITAAKRLDVVLEAFAKLDGQMRLQIVGLPITSADHPIAAALLKQARERGIETRVSWGPQTGDELRATYQRAWCLLHASDTGLDKVVLEAMASECLVVSTATTSQAVLPPVCQAHDALSLAESVRALQQLSPEAEHELRRHLRQTIVDRHSLNQLATRLVAEMSQTS